MDASRTLDPAVVLIAEDDDLIADLLAFIVEQSGAVPLMASDGQQALRLARQRCPTLLIAESIMSGLDGKALMAAVRAECGTDLPTILMTSSPKAHVNATATTAVLSKPFHLATLEEQLARFLGTYSLQY